MTDNEVRVLEAIRQLGAAEKPVSRADLVQATALPDRAIRKAKENLIKKYGYRVETHPRGGYYLAAENDGATIAQKMISQGWELVSTGKKLLKLASRATAQKFQLPLFERKNNEHRA